MSFNNFWGLVVNKGNFDTKIHSPLESRIKRPVIYLCDQMIEDSNKTANSCNSLHQEVAEHKKAEEKLSTKNDYESTGVGLTLAKKIVELYGGKIWIESKVSQGSTFFFTLPMHSERVQNEQFQTNFVD